MGLGKTIQIITLLKDAYGTGERQPSLIICPASLVYNWEHEIGRFAPDLRVLSIVGNGPEREARLESVREQLSGGTGDGCQVLVTSYDLLKRDIRFYEDIHFRYQVIDEAQYIKNAATQSAKAVKAIDVRTRFALTGTPVENRLSEIWSLSLIHISSIPSRPMQVSSTRLARVIRPMKLSFLASSGSVRILVS